MGKSHNSSVREILLEVGHNSFPANWDCLCCSGTLSEEDWKPPLPAYDFLQMMEHSMPQLSPHLGDTPAQQPPKSPGGDTAGGDTGTREEPSQESTAEEVGSPGRGLRGTAPRLAARDKQGKRHSEL